MLRKLFSYLALGFALSAADIRPKATVTTPVASVSFINTNFVQVASTSSEVSSASIKVPITVTAGHTLFLSVVEGSSPAITVSDKLGNSFTKIQSNNNGNLVRTLATYYSVNIKGGVDTVIAAFSGGTNHTRLTVSEYQGIVAVDTFVQTQADAGNPTVTAQARAVSDLAVCAIETNVDTLVPVGFTLRKQVIDMGVLDSSVTAIGNVTCNGTLRRSQSWLLQLATFKTVVSTGNDSQNVKIKWKSSHVNAPDSIEGYWVNLYRNGTLFYYQTSCGPGCTSGIPSRYWVQAFPTDTVDSVIITKVPPPDSGKTADYHISIQAVSNIARGGQCCVTSPIIWYLYRRTNVTKAQLPIDSVQLTIKSIVPASFGIFGDSFRLFSKVYSDTNSTNPAAMKYIGTTFPRNTTFITTQVRTNRYSYYMTPYLFGVLVDTIYLGTMEIPNK